jgi:hypothetical protein
MVTDGPDAHVDPTCGWSVSFTGFGVASALPQRGCKGNTIALHLNWLLGVALQGLRGAAPKTNYNSPRYPADRRHMNDIIARPLAVIGD